jgi:hypothetical protein
MAAVSAAATAAAAQPASALRPSYRTTIGRSHSQRAVFRGGSIRSSPVGAKCRRGAALRVQAEQDLDGPAIKVDISLAEVKRGKKIGSGSFGDVFEVGAACLESSIRLSPSSMRSSSPSRVTDCTRPMRFTSSLFE